MSDEVPGKGTVGYHLMSARAISGVNHGALVEAVQQHLETLPATEPSNSSPAKYFGGEVSQATRPLSPACPMPWAHAALII